MTLKEKVKQFSLQNNKRFIAATIMAAIGVTSAMSVSALSKDVNIKDGDSIIHTRTIYSDVKKILDNVHVQVSDEDKIVADNTKQGVLNIDIKRAFTVNLVIDDEVKTIRANDGTVKDLLEINNITLPENKITSLSLNKELTPGMTINIVDLVNITIEMNGEVKSLGVPFGTLGNALEFLNVSIPEGYGASIDLNAEVAEGMYVVLGVIETREEEEFVEIPFETVQKSSDSLLRGKSKIEQSGENGERLVLNKRKYISGKLIDSEEINSTVVKEPIEQVEICGTKVQPVKRTSANTSVTVNSDNQTLTDSNGNVMNYSKVIKGTCTAYSAKAGARTAYSGSVRYGVVAVDPRVIPYGTELYIKSPDGSVVYGRAIAGDTGGAMRSGRVLADLFYNSEAECNRFGRRQMELYVLS